MLKAELLEIIANGENSGVEFKLDDVRPEQLAKEVVALVNFQGGMILLGVADDGTIPGIHRTNLEAWVMDTVFSRFVHPLILPFYEEIQLNDDTRVAVISFSQGISKPYVVRHRDREDVFIRVGSTSRLATREQQARLYALGGMLHPEIMPVPGTAPDSLDRARVDNYLRDILKDPEVPDTPEQWSTRLQALGFLVEGPDGQPVCTIAGLVLFGIAPRRYLKQAGLRVLAFAGSDKSYQALLDEILDGPLVGRWAVEKSGGRTLVDEGLIEKFIRSLRPFISQEAEEIDQTFRREKTWFYPRDAVRETVINALVHRDWTRFTDIEIGAYADRLEVMSPGALQNSMTVEKMKAGQRVARNPILVEVLRDYGYVEARGMGVRTKVIPLMRQMTGTDPQFEATEDYLKTVLCKGRAR
jgi:ATP-dependent DNA helicase RecG